MTPYIQYLSIFLEALIAILGILIALHKKAKIGWLIFLTFIIYVFYDLTKTTTPLVSEAALSILFLIATASMLTVVWHLYSKHPLTGNSDALQSRLSFQKKQDLRQTKRFSHRALKKTLFGYRKR